MKEELKKIFIFSNLDDATLEQIAALTKQVELYKDNILFYEGDDSHCLHILTKGIIKLYKTASNGKELLLKYFQNSELIAEAASFQQIPFPATAQAYTACTVLKIDFNAFKEILLKNPELSFKLNISLIQKIKNLENIISTQLVLETKEKVAHYIYHHEESFFNTKKVLIAQMLNLTPETLSRALKVFKEEGLVNTKTKIIDKEGLKAYFS
jgi:CRP/FNR family transcriptional regulator